MLITPFGTSFALFLYFLLLGASLPFFTCWTLTLFMLIYISSACQPPVSKEIKLIYKIWCKTVVINCYDSVDHCNLNWIRFLRCVFLLLFFLPILTKMMIEGCLRLWWIVFLKIIFFIFFILKYIKIIFLISSY
jgi:hypothetical protein